MKQKERLIKLLNQYFNEIKEEQNNNNDFAEFLISKGVLAPRFKLGDKAYFVCEVQNPLTYQLEGYTLKEAKIEKIIIDNDCMNDNAINISYGTEDIYQGNAYCPTFEFDSDCVFATIEEAQKEMKNYDEDK